VRDAAYHSLLRNKCQDIHRSIAQALEERFPEITETQPELVAHHFTEAGLGERAIAYWHRAGRRATKRSANREAVGHLTKGLEVHPQMMVPQVCTAAELRWIKGYVEEIKAEVEAASGQALNCRFGTMIEVVRACMRAGKLAEEADFFSFGTNDLTQAAFSFSREDAENKFLPLYNQSDILHDNPFEVLDTKGVGKLMEIAVQWGRQTKTDLSVGICGEHGGHPSSIAFCHQAGLNYVSCSPPRVPVARLAAAHAALKT